MDEIITKKYCTRCKQTKEINFFGKDKYCKDGIRKWCKSCRLEIARVWRNANRERINKKLRDWYAEHPGKNHEYSQTYLSKEEKRTLIKKANQKWKLENREKSAEYRRNRRAIKKHSGGLITAKQWRLVLEKYGNKCLCCGKSGIKLTMDHVVPLSIGGLHDVGNIQPLCLSCNSKKHIKIIDYRKEAIDEA